MNNLQSHWEEYKLDFDEPETIESQLSILINKLIELIPNKEDKVKKVFQSLLEETIKTPEKEQGALWINLKETIREHIFGGFSFSRTPWAKKLYDIWGEEKNY